MLIPAAIQSGFENPCVNLLRIPQNQILLALDARSVPPCLHCSAKKGKPRDIRACDSSSSSVLDDKGRQKLGVVVKPMERPRLVLKFIWMENNIGIAIEQVIPGGHGTIPLSPYYFWPRKDAWEELKTVLGRKPWISDKQMVILLNQATDIINLWQHSDSGGELAS